MMRVVSCAITPDSVRVPPIARPFVTRSAAMSLQLKTIAELKGPRNAKAPGDWIARKAPPPATVREEQRPIERPGVDRTGGQQAFRAGQFAGDPPIDRALGINGDGADALLEGKR